MQKLLVTMKDIQRYKVLKDVLDKKLKGVEAAQILTLLLCISQGLRPGLEPAALRKS